MTTLSAIYLRMPNWIGDVCMTLPCLEALLQTNLPVIVCARPWARDLLSGYPLHDFIEMDNPWYKSAMMVRQHHKQIKGVAGGLLLPDSLSSALIFRLAGVHSAGHRDDGR